MSEQPKHTPGPWATWQNESDKGTNYWRIRTAPDIYGMQDNIHGYCGEANAHLIAAAPELLEALKTCVAFIEDAHIVEAQWGWEPVKEAKAAIAKAEGGNE